MNVVQQNYTILRCKDDKLSDDYLCLDDIENHKIWVRKMSKVMYHRLVSLIKSLCPLSYTSKINFQLSENFCPTTREIADMLPFDVLVQKKNSFKETFRSSYSSTTSWGSANSEIHDYVAISLKHHMRSLPLKKRLSILWKMDN